VIQQMHFTGLTWAGNRTYVVRPGIIMLFYVMVVAFGKEAYVREGSRMIG
jgi:hypothetical protein